MIEDHSSDPTWRPPSERELAEELEVSRTVIREAVIALEMRGIVEVRGRSGIVVLPPRANQISFDAINTDIGPGPFELLEARLVIESGAASLAANRATPYDISELEECITQMQGRANETALSEKGDRDFHMIVANMTGNAIIVSMMEALWDQRDASLMWKKVYEQLHAPAVQPLWAGDHYAIVSALKMRNSDAAHKAMTHHIRNVMNELLEAEEQGHFSSENDA